MSKANRERGRGREREGERERGRERGGEGERERVPHVQALHCSDVDMSFRRDEDAAGTAAAVTRWTNAAGILVHSGIARFGTQLVCRVAGARQ